ncbi:hypothetical protein, partial [Streptomyces cinnamoneus]|uniref:hypothetical protein n=1 Tax=Streptomyces cinnamoneus TaxID=53446 RepID=UPI0019620786
MERAQAAQDRTRGEGHDGDDQQEGGATCGHQQDDLVLQLRRPFVGVGEQFLQLALVEGVQLAGEGAVGARQSRTSAAARRRKRRPGARETIAFSDAGLGLPGVRGEDPLEGVLVV